ncbi:MAG TPA: zinc-dependent metalloprotease [Candidatus Polarisedimenticolia bacterium]|nr:zinc-dependent metalloprotease [Candidatus Polarisedimenticolia bacterium]
MKKGLWLLAALLLAVPAPAGAVDEPAVTDPAVQAKDSEGVDLPARGRKKADDKAASGPGGPVARKDEPAFDDVIKDHAAIKGLMTLHEKDGRYLLEILPEQLDRDFMLSLTRETGVGQFGLLAAQVLGEVPVRFHKVGKKVQLLLRNTRFAAETDPDIRRAVAKSFSDSLAGSSKIESAPHPESKAILVDLAPLLVSDVEGVGAFFGQVFQTPYNLDRENSHVSAVKGFPRNMEIEARLHFAAGRPANLVNLPDPRSLFITYRFSLSDVPAAPGFLPRIADDRVGHFLALYQDFSDDRRETPYVRYVTRWNLEKEEPYAALSKPKEPITYWIENSVPKKYRKALADGTLMWNRAFEKIGFKDAVVVKQQPDDADWDPADVRYATIRWFIATDTGFAIGPSRINPMTGQIYDADIGWSESIIAGRLREYEELTDPVTALQDLFRSMEMKPESGRDPRFACDFARGAVEQIGFGLELLEARGVLPGSPQADEYINGFITYVQAHEVGHTLGLRHNFRSSVERSYADLHDAGLTGQKGLVGSVMDYVPVNIAANGKAQGQYWPTTLGSYDHWAIEYAYKPIPGVKKPEDELPELKAIASRVAELGLSYGTDEDTEDPRTNTWDLGSEPVSFYADRASLVKELWKGMPDKLARPGEGYQLLRRAFMRGFTQYALAVFNVTKSIGGLHTHRDHVADPQGRLPMVPVAADRQRAALDFVRANVFAPEAFDFQPDTLNRLALTRWWDFNGNIFQIPRMEFPLHDVVLALQQLTLQALYNPVKLDRLVDLEMHVARGQKAFTLAEMFSGVHESVWAEVYGTGVPRINSFRRALQRDHLKRLADMMVRPAPQAPEDAATMARANLSDLSKRIAASLGGTALDAATRAHLEETRARIEAALTAQVIRQTS